MGCLLPYSRKAGKEAAQENIAYREWSVWSLCFFAATAIASPAQTFTTLHSFDGTFPDGGTPLAGLLQGTDGNFYGTTKGGYCTGVSLCGTVFKITPGGTLTTLHRFGGDGLADPWAGLLQATDGNFYGTTLIGGAYGDGAVFKITPGGMLTVLYSFTGNGEGPYTRVVQGSDGNFYGTTLGFVFRITPGGSLTELHSFNYTDGVLPYGTLIQATDGNFYGTAAAGGLRDVGTIFKITPGGRFTLLFQFYKIVGANPTAGLVQGTDGSFYGTTFAGGDIKNCQQPLSVGCGTVFKITPGGTLTTLHRFEGTDGCGPRRELVQGTDGSFYGTTTTCGNGTGGNGTVFRITPGGTFTTLHRFQLTDGDGPNELVQGTDGNFYGTTIAGGPNGFNSYGTVFRLSVGLAPFVETRPTSGKVGANVIVLGTNLRGATSVSFNGTAATFQVVSDSEITATVPAGATTGTVKVTTPSGTLSSNVRFRVRPQILSFSPTSGPIGTRVVITGESFTGATGVTLACKWLMTFTVDSDTQITAVVPSNGTTGQITVFTPGGHAETTAKFTVTP
jgi:uncharacterized repeat protein (TIGR03803 family)